MSAPIIYDFAIIGAGAAGLHLALAMVEDDWFYNKQILIIDKAAKDTNDRTWSFWEKGNGKWDTIITKSWEKGQFSTTKKSLDLNLAPYCYKMLPAIAFYNLAKTKIAQATNFHWQKEEVEEVLSGKMPTIKCSNNTYQAKRVFDSRIDKGFENRKDKYIRLLQHFKGWEIETEATAFDSSTFVMMDFQVKWKNSTCFTYVLPVSATKALIEFTLFTPTLIPYDAYDDLLKEYIEQILKIKKYQIAKVEYGVIPMSNYPFEQAHQKGITKVGTAGGWVKPSSGYAFKNCEQNALKVIANLKQQLLPEKGLIQPKFRFYDSIFLDVLHNYNHLGAAVFTDMYTKNDISQILKFLDEDTSLMEEIKIMSSFKFAPFLKALRRYLFRV